MGLIEKLAMPELKDGEVEDFLGIASEGNVLREHSFDSTFLEISARGRLGIEQKVAHPVLEVLTEPSFIRHRETGLFALDNFTRHEFAEGFLGDVLGGETANFEILWQ